MLNNPIIEVGIGLIFFFLILSLVCSAVQEWFASIFKLRSATLREGIANLLDDDLAKAVYDHPMIGKLAKPGKLPSYIDPHLLSSVVLDLVSTHHDQAAGKSFLDREHDELDDMIASLPDGHALKPILRALRVKGENAVADLRKDLAEWFDLGMDRVGGWYARKVKAFLVLFALVVTAATNANTITFAQALWQNDTLREQIASEAQTAGASGTEQETHDKMIADLRAFPIGWNPCKVGTLDPSAVCDDFADPAWYFKTLIGWLITVAAISLGAPFWFGLLNKVVSLRGAGTNPNDKKKKDGT